MKNDIIYMHEYGRYLQSQEMGFGYLSGVAVPSVFSAAKNDDYHDFQPFEQDANRRAFMYFNKEIPGFYKSQIDQAFYGNTRGWNFYSNPLDVYHVGKKSRRNYYDYHNPAHKSLINSLALRANFADYARWLFMPVAPAGSLFWFGSNSLINTLWYNSTRVTD